MKKLAVALAATAIAGSALAYDDELAWVYDTSKRPADTVSVKSADITNMDARPNVELALATGTDLEARSWFSWLSDIISLTPRGFMVIFR